jgi:hypothetical protein
VTIAERPRRLNFCQVSRDQAYILCPSSTTLTVVFRLHDTRTPPTIRHRRSQCLADLTERSTLPQAQPISKKVLTGLKSSRSIRVSFKSTFDSSLLLFSPQFLHRLSSQILCLLPSSFGLTTCSVYQRRADDFITTQTSSCEVLLSPDILAFTSLHLQALSINLLADAESSHLQASEHLYSSATSLIDSATCLPCRRG